MDCDFSYSQARTKKNLKSRSGLFAGRTTFCDAELGKRNKQRLAGLNLKVMLFLGKSHFWYWTFQCPSVQAVKVKAGLSIILIVSLCFEFRLLLDTFRVFGEIKS